jgi:hypothetical protein
MSNHIAVSAMLTVFVSLSASAPKLRDDAKPDFYLPSAVGDKRVFETRMHGKTNEVVEWVTAVENKGGMVIVSFSCVENGPTLYQYRASSDGVFRVSAGEKVYKPLHRVLKLPAKEGETWEETSPDQEDTANPKMKYTTGKGEEVEVPAGKFRAVRVEVESNINSAVIRTTYWHVVGLGAVKILTRYKDGDRVQVLKAFTPGKK